MSLGRRLAKGKGKDTDLDPNTPHYSLFAGVALVIVGVVAALLTNDRNTMTLLLGLIVTTVPSLLAAGYAERASRDIRNGTVTEKARQGTTKALEETGVTDAVALTGRGRSSILAMEALSALLQERAAREEAVAQVVVETPTPPAPKADPMEPM